MKKLFLLVLIAGIYLDVFAYQRGYEMTFSDLWRDDCDVAGATDSLDPYEKTIYKSFEEDYGGCSIHYCISRYDTNVVFRWISAPDLGVEVIYLGQMENPFGFVEHYIRSFYEAGCLSISREQLDTLFFVLKQKMNLSNNVYHVEAPYEVEGHNYICCSPSVIDSQIDSIVKARNPDEPDYLQNILEHPQGIFISNGIAIVPAEYVGQKYSLLDMNVKALREGVLSSSLQLPDQPCVLKINGQPAIFVK